MYTCGACGGKHASAREGWACYGRPKSPSVAKKTTAKKTTAKKTTAKKTAAKKTAAKKTAAKKTAARKTAARKTAARKTAAKKYGRKKGAKKKVKFYVKASERLGAARPRVKSTRRGESRSSPSENQAAPKEKHRSGPSQRPKKPTKPARYKKSRGGKSRRVGEVWQPPSEESKGATPKFDRDNRQDYL